MLQDGSLLLLLISIEVLVSPAYIGSLERFTNTKSKYTCPVGTAGLCGFVVLLLLLQNWSSQHVYTVLGPYSEYMYSCSLQTPV